MSRSSSATCRTSRVRSGKFVLRQMLSVAELEAGMVGERTKKALARRVGARA